MAFYISLILIKIRYRFKKYEKITRLYIKYLLMKYFIYYIENY